MYFATPRIFITIISTILVATTTAAAAFFPRKTRFLIDTTISPINDTQKSVKSESVAIPVIPRNNSIVLAQNLSNNTSPFSDEGLIIYKVPRTPTTLEIHSFGSPIPADEILTGLASAVGKALQFLRKSDGNEPIANRGYFRYSQSFPGDSEFILVLADFREIGKEITYFVLRDVLRGLGEFVMSPEGRYSEFGFEVVMENGGYVGSGHVDYRPGAKAKTQ